MDWVLFYYVKLHSNTPHYINCINNEKFRFNCITM